MSYEIKKIEYRGYIINIDLETKEITADLININDKNENIIIQFTIYDIDIEDIDKIKNGTRISWKITIENINDEEKYTHKINLEEPQKWSSLISKEYDDLVEKLYNKLNIKGE